MDYRNKDIREILNSLGIIFIFLVVFAVFVGFAAPYIAPQSFLGERMESPFAKLVYIGIVIAVSYILEIMLKYVGINFVKK